MARRNMPLPGRHSGINETGRHAASADAARLAEILRVDHAGEHGAVKIYEGQLAVLGKARRMHRVAAQIREMAEHEQHHLDTFNRLLPERGVRPTALFPLWSAAGFTLGAVTALMGEKAAMACTAAVETVIDEHYRNQLDEIPDDEAALKETIAQFREDELHHRDIALEEGAEKAFGYPVLSGVIKAGCRLAIRLSEKV